MYKFKVGDKVRLISNKAGSYNEVGDVGTVMELSNKDCRVSIYNDPKELQNWSFYSDIELVEYEDQWHLNNGGPIPKGADTLEKDGSVVAYRKIKEPEVVTKEVTLHLDSFDDTFETYEDCEGDSLGTVNFTLTLTDGVLTDVKAEIV